MRLEADDRSVNRKVSRLSVTSPVCSQLRTNCCITANVERGHYRKSPPPWIKLRRQGGEQLLRFLDLWKLRRRREAFERGREHRVTVGGAIV
jgi:hypothetical protein